MQTSTAPSPETNAPAATDAPAAALAPISALPGLEHRLRVFADISRWATLFLGLAAGIVTGPTDIRFVASCVALAVSAIAQHAEPVTLSPPNYRTRVRVVLELVLTLVAVLATGGGASPFVLTPMTAIVLAGYVWGDRIVVAVALSTGVAVAAGAAAQIGRAETGTTAAIAVIYLLCGMLGAFGRSLLTEVEEQRAATLDQATQMATANELLVALHGLAQTLPASFDLGDVVTSTRNRLRALLEFDAIVVLVRDDTGDQWVVELADG